MVDQPDTAQTTISDAEIDAAMRKGFTDSEFQDVGDDVLIVHGTAAELREWMRGVLEAACAAKT